MRTITARGGGALIDIYLGFMLLEVGLVYGLLNRWLGIFRGVEK